MPKKLNRIMTCLLITMGFIVVSQSVVAQEYLPCDSSTKGYYYSYQHSYYTPELLSDMPYDIMVGYIIADSVLRNASPVEISNFVYSLGYNDTLKYILKYMYLLSDYDPIRYSRFLLTQPTPRSSGYGTQNHVFQRVSVLPDGALNGRLVAPDYILHLRVNETVTTEIPDGLRCKSLIASHSTVIDKIKGQILPPLGTHYGLTTVGSNSGNGESEEISLPAPTDFVFEYCPNWERRDVNGGKWNSIICPDGTPWIKPSQEYIVFTKPIFYRSCETTAYYAMTPLGGTYSAGMYPIENGNVIDKDNSFGWGEVVPVETFKQNLRNLINTIKNYGE